MSAPQLIMRNPDITKTPKLVLPEGFSVHAHEPGREKVWEEIIESSFGSRFDFDFLIKAGDYSPEKVLYLSKDGRDIATTTAVENSRYPGEGWFRMVGVRKDAQGMGAGKLISTAALNALAQRGYRSAVLSTDDHRISAIRLYLSVGFEPMYAHESHALRWKKVLEGIENEKKIPPTG